MTITANSADTRERLDDIIASHRDREGPLLPILHDVQAEWGFIPDEVQPVVEERARWSGELEFCTQLIVSVLEDRGGERNDLTHPRFWGEVTLWLAW